MSDSELASRAVAQGLLTRVAADECLALAKDFSSRGVPLTFLEICLKRALLTPEQVRRLQADATPTGQTVKLDYGPAGPAPASTTRVGRYEILDELGRGGMGVVYRAVHPDLKSTVAIKVLAMDNVSPEDVTRFRREAQTSARLVHPNIVSTHDFGEADGRYYLAMSYIDGIPFSKIIGSEAYTLYDQLKLLAQVCDAVAYAHDQGIIHRDLKPANILVSRSGTAFVTDFGLARTVDSRTHLTLTGMIMGTPAYMSPEQARGDPLDPRSDIYSLGAVLYETLSGRTPFVERSAANILLAIVEKELTPPRAIRKGIPRELETICLKAMDKNPLRRYRSAADLGADLRRFLAGDPILARPPSLIYRITRRLSKQKAAWIVAAVALVLAGGTFGVVRYLARRAERARLEALEREAADKLAVARKFFDEGRGDAVLEDLKEIVTKYPDTRAAPEAQYLIAEVHRAAKREREMIDALAKTYRIGYESEWGRRALFRLAEHFLRNGKEAIARKQFEKILARAPGSEEAKLSLFRLAEIAERFNEIPLARGYYRAAIAAGHPESAAARRREEWLVSIGRVVSIPVLANACAAGDVDGDGRSDLLVGSLRTLTVYHLDAGGQVRTGVAFTLPVTDYHITAIAVADLDGDSRNEVLVTSVEFGHRTGWLRVLRTDSQALVEVARDECGSEVPPGAMVVTDLDRDGLPEIFVGAQYARYKSFIYHWRKNRLEKTPLCRDLELTDGSPDAFGGWNESEVNVIRCADIDGDGQRELVLATGAWTAYDIRVLDYKAGQARLRTRQLMGTMSAMDVFDWDGDGQPEILAAKSNFYGTRPAIFGLQSPSGVAEGLYSLRIAKDGQLTKSLLEPFAGGDEAVIRLTCVSGARLGTRWVLIITHLEYTPELRRTFAQVNVREGDSVERTILNVESSRVHPVPNTALIADLTGDGQNELILTGQDVKIYAAEDRVVQPRVPSPISSSDPLASAADDLFEMGIYADAAVAYEKLSLRTGDEERKCGAIFRVAECLERSGHIDEAAETLERLAREFPGRAPEAIARECAVLGRHFRWAALAQRTGRWNPSRIPPEAQEWASRAQRQAEVRFQAEPGNWPLTFGHPFLASQDDRGIRIALPGQITRAATHPFQLDGSPFALRLELEIERIEWGSYFRILLTHQESEARESTHLSYALSMIAGDRGALDESFIGFAHLRGSHQDILTHRVGKWDGRRIRLSMDYGESPARVLLEARDVDSGELIWSRLVELSAPLPRGRYELGLTGSNAGTGETAVVRLQKLVVTGTGLVPTDAPRTGLDRAHGLVLAGDLKAALAAYETQASDRVAGSEARRHAILVRARLGQPSLAETVASWPGEERDALENELEMIVRSAADGPDLARRLLPPVSARRLLLDHARKLQKHKLFGQAEQFYKDLLPDAEAVFLLGECLYALGRFDEARAQFERATELRPEDWRPLIMQARIAAQRGFAGTALDFLRRAVQLGVRNYDMVGNDQAFATLADHPGFKALIEELKKKATQE